LAVCASSKAFFSFNVISIFNIELAINNPAERKIDASLSENILSLWQSSNPIKPQNRSCRKTGATNIDNIPCPESCSIEAGDIFFTSPLIHFPSESICSHSGIFSR
jgi:hypothetical protein